MFCRIALIGAILLSVMVSAARAADVAPAADGTNLLPDVVSSRNWAVWNPSGMGSDACTTTPEDEAMRVDIPKKQTAAPGERGFGCTKVSVKAGTVYTLRFTAKASESFKITLSALEPSKRGESIIGQGAIQLKPSWQTFVCRIAPVRDSVPQAWVPYFDFGDNIGTVWFRNITLTETNAGSDASAVPAKSAGSTPQSLIADMDNPATWFLKEREGAKGSIRREGDSLRVDITAVTQEAWHLCFMHTGSELPGARSYVFKFSARASVPTKISLSGQRGEEPYDDLAPVQSMPLTTQWQEYSWKFALAKPCTVKDVLPIVQVGATTGTIWFRNMSLTAE